MVSPTGLDGVATGGNGTGKSSGGQSKQPCASGATLCQVFLGVVRLFFICESLGDDRLWSSRHREVS
jgi:hypothetical protein